MAVQNYLAGIPAIGQDLPQVANMLYQRQANEQDNALRARAMGMREQEFAQGQQQFQAQQQTQQQEQALREKYAEMEALTNAPPEYKAQYVEMQKRQHPNFAQTPFASMPHDQAFEAMRRGLAAKLGMNQKQPDTPASFREFELGQQNPAYAKFLEGKQPKGTDVHLSVNTADDFYGNLAKDQSKAFSDLYGQATSAPERIRRADAILQLLQKTPYTGAGAEWKLAVGKSAKALGFDYAGDDIANTETLARELAGSTLEAIKTSGMGGGTGFSNADRDFLEKVTGGKITLDAGSLRRVAILNKRAAKNTISQYNTRAGKLRKDQLDIMGLPQSIGGGEAEQQDAHGLVVGKKYTDADGNVATYLGNGQWRE
jgi:hypothetical protein